MSMFKSLSTGGSNWADDEIEIPQPAPVSSSPTVDDMPEASVSAAPALQEREVEGQKDGYLRKHKKQQEQERDDRPQHEERPCAPVPDAAPFIAHVGNLPYTVTEDDLTSLFKGLALETEKMRIPMDYQTKQPKGFAYVEFTDRESLVEALTRKGELVGERHVRIDVAVERKSKYQQRRDHREPFRGGDFQQSFGGNRREYQESRNHHRGPYRNYGNDVDETSDENVKDYFHRRTSAKSKVDDHDNKDLIEGEVERPKLKLLARSSEDTTTTNGETKESRKASIFGAAKPRDETQTKYSQTRKSSIDEVMTTTSTDENKMNKSNTSTPKKVTDRQTSTDKSSEKKSWKRGETEQLSSDRRESNTKGSQHPRGGRGVGGKNHRQVVKTDEELMKQAMMQVKKPSTKVTNAFSCLDSESESDSDEE